jgi:Na+-driven multidrug efflux pump
LGIGDWGLGIGPIPNPQSPFYKSGLYLLSSLPIFLKHILNLIFLGHSQTDSFNTVLLLITSYQIGFILISTLGYDFILGASEAFDRLAHQAIEKEDHGLLYKIYNEAKIYSFIIFILSTLPFGYSADYILYFLNFDEGTYTLAGNFAKLCLISVFFEIFNRINSKFLILQGYPNIVMSTNIFVLVIHILSLLTFNYTFKMGVTGCGVSLIVSSLFEYVILQFYVNKYHPFQEDQIIIGMDTSTLQSSKFYIYVKYGSYAGVVYFMKKLTMNFIILGSYYLVDKNNLVNNEMNLTPLPLQDKISLTTNILLVNYIMFIHEIFKSLCLPIKELYYTYVLNYGVLHFRKSERYSNLNNNINGNSNLGDQSFKPKEDFKSELNKNILNFSLKIGFASITVISILNYLLNSNICSLFFSKDNSVYTDNSYGKVNIICENFSFITKIYSIFIFFDFMCTVTAFILKTIHKNYSLESFMSLSIITVFFPLALLLSFSFGFSYAGFWYAYFASLMLFSVIDYYYIQRLDLLKVSSKIKKYHATNLYDEKTKEKS